MPDKESKTKKNKIPWPTNKVMQQIYDKKLWGGDRSDFYSGEGSYDLNIINPYIDVLSTFLTSFKSPLSVCDLGCGDFNVSKALVEHTRKYIAIDIVPNLIARNKEKFKEEHLEFHCLDIAVDDLPSGDCAIVRQVLQHLSNAEIQRIVEKLSNFKYVIVTEHVPEGNFVPNMDIISGQGIRLKKQSGVNLLVSPFHFKVKEKQQLLAVMPKDSSGVIITSLYEVF